MAPRGPGGRPRNAWTLSRSRKLVRLYTLTRLSKQEIQKVLAADDFNPCPRDIQKRLHSLLPPDYHKDHRRFRPSDDAHMKLRFDHLRRCRKGRISKERCCRSLAVLRSRTPTVHAASKTLPDSFESYATAFRNYATSPEPGPTIPSSNLLDSQTVDPSLLLLDGSSLPSRKDISSDHFTSTTVDNLRFHQGQRSRMNLDGEVARQQSSRLSSYLKEVNSKIARVRGLEKQLANKYSDSDVKHISSVLRFSSSNSWRSSLTSLSSRASSLLSKFFNRDTLAIESSSYISRKDSSLRIQDPTASGEDGPNALFRLQDIHQDEVENWLEWLDEGSMSQHHASRIPPYHNISPLNRRCCPSMLNPLDSRYPSCEKCGFYPEHRRAVQLRSLTYANPSNVNTLDFYGNTPLHCAAASVERGEFAKIRYMVEQEVDVTICNSFGETFLHVLCGQGPTTTPDMAEFIEILRYVSKTNFPFSKPDHHGRTILHRLIQHSPNTHTVSFLSQTFSIMKPNISWQDNAGFRVDKFLEDPCNRVPGATHDELRGALIPFCGSCSNFAYFDSSRSNRSLASIWPRLKRRPWCITSIDVAGDTPLSSILKYWRLPNECPLEDSLADTSYPALREIVEDMISLGVDIHMRDRSGDTALAIAARRGHRAVIVLLLDKEANVHSRNYRGFGILWQLKQLMNANTQNVEFWALLWSCHLVLTDAGAKYSPTESDEWMSPLSGTLHNQRQSFSQPHHLRDIRHQIDPTPTLISSTRASPSYREGHAALGRNALKQIHNEQYQALPHSHSTCSGISDRTSYAKTSVASTIYGKNAIVPALPPQTVVRGKPALVIIKSNGASSSGELTSPVPNVDYEKYGANGPPSPAISVGSTILNNANTDTQMRPQVVPAIGGPNKKRSTSEIIPKDDRKPTASQRGRQTPDIPSSNGSVEIFKSFRVSMEDPCYKVLPAALKKYNINAPWESYALYIVYADQERCIGMEEKPLILFKQLDKEGKKPMFMLRKINPAFS